MNVKDIKEFAITILMENEELNNKVGLSYEFLEGLFNNQTSFLFLNFKFYLLKNFFISVASEYITSKILQEIKFYQNFDPYTNLKRMLFEQGKN